MPRRPCGVVVAVQERGGAHWPARRRLLPEALTRRRIAVLQLDLRSEHEADDRVILFDSELLAERLTAVVRWVRSHPRLGGQPVGLQGMASGAAIVLRAAAMLGHSVQTTVAAGDRPDLAADAIRRIRSPTLLIAGGGDRRGLARNRSAVDALRCPQHLAIVPGAYGRLDEPAALDTAARLATRWFVERFAEPAAPAP